MPSTRNEVIERLRRMPDRLARLVEDKSEADLRRAGSGGDWGAVEYLANLTDFDEVSLVRIDQVVAGGDPELEVFDTDIRAIEMDYHAQDPFETLERFRSNRQELVHRLENLSDEDWERPARHPVAGCIDLERLVNLIDEYDQRTMRALQDDIL